MKKIRKWLYPAYSWLINAAYWVRNLTRYEDVQKQIDAIKPRNLNDVIELMEHFQWTRDTMYDWRPWLSTIVANDLKDDCDGAAVLGKWALEQIGMPARYVNLWAKGKQSGHAITVSNDNKIMISNNAVIYLDKDWEKDILEYHGGMFDTIEEG